MKNHQHLLPLEHYIMHPALNLPVKVVETLFPWHILIDNSNSQLVLSLGSSLIELLQKHEAVPGCWNDFEVKRPTIDALSHSNIQNHLESPFIIAVKDTAITLRGQILLTECGNFLFLGSLLVESSDSFDKTGAVLRQFAPFDLSPEMLMLHRFREVQLRDQLRKVDELKEVEAARLASDEHANSDALTGIANRRGFWRDGEALLESRNPKEDLYILLFDLERFKATNDKYGHAVGDKVLLTVAERLNTKVADHGIAARLGGDEFVALVSLSCDISVPRWIQNLGDFIRRPAASLKQGLPIDCSIGVTTVASNQTLDDAVQAADYAMYEGRKSGPNSITWDSHVLQLRRKQQHLLCSDLKNAIDDSEIYPVFQPLVDLSDNNLIGFEALARWHHPELGMILPLTFIEVAERSGLLPSLDQHILEKALDCLALWHSQGKPYTMHINVSAPSLQTNLAEIVELALSTRDLDGKYLILELTETSFLEHSIETRELLQAITKLGVRLELDDFGTGYSSLTHLHDFPVSGIKIDRSFVAEAHKSRRAELLLRSIMSIAENLGLDTVGEGIENLEQLELLQEIGCLYGQGYLFGKPSTMDSCEVLEFLALQKAA